jgi:hypothetical protein
LLTQSRRSARAERGDGKIGAIIAVLVVALAIHVGMKFIPFKVQVAEFEQKVEEKFTELAGNVIGEEDFMDAVLARAEEMQVPISEDNVQLELVGSTWKLAIDYEVVLGMVWGDWVQQVDLRLERGKF